MGAGKPGDSPFTDVVVYKRDVYSAVASALIREIATLADDKTRRALAGLLLEKFNPHSRPNVDELEQYLTGVRDQLRKEASARGFELDQ